MEKWKREAISRFPEFTAEDHRGWKSPYLCWFDLTAKFHTAYDNPRNEDLIRRVYAFAQWCSEQPEGRSAEDDLGTVVAVSFVEHIPDSDEALADMPRWFTLEETKKMKDLLSYHAGPEGFEKILMAYEKAKA